MFDSFVTNLKTLHTMTQLTNFRRLSVLVTLLTASIISSCQKTEEQPETNLNLESDSISIPCEGGTFSLSFTIDNKKDDTEVRAECESEWISDITVNMSEGTVSFTAAANESESTRTCEVTIECTGCKSSYSFSIIQTGSPTEESPFIITIKEVTTSTVTLDITPADSDMTYIPFVTTAQYYSRFKDEESLFQDDLKYFKKESENTGMPLSDVISQYCGQGEVLDARFSHLAPDTDYVFYIYGIDLQLAERLTDIVTSEFTTGQVEMTDAEFTFTINVDSPFVDKKIEAVNYDGYFYTSAYPDLKNDGNLKSYCNETWEQTKMFFISFGYTNEQILNNLCYKNEYSSKTEMDPGTKYLAVAFAVNEEALMCSDVSAEEFNVPPVPQSDNTITLSVYGIGSRKAEVKAETTNDDIYAVFIIPTFELSEYTSDEQIANACLNYYEVDSRSGSFEETATGLEPSTEYSFIAFGYKGSYTTTKVSRFDFTTIEASGSDVGIELLCYDYYDSEAVAALDPTWEGSYDESTCLLPITAVINPEHVKRFYYGLLNSDYISTLSDEEIIENIVYNGPRKETEIIFKIYGYEIVAVAIAEDAEGNYGPLWRSEPIYLSKDNVSDPQEFIDKYSDNYRMTVSKIRNANNDQTLYANTYPMNTCRISLDR